MSLLQEEEVYQLEEVKVAMVVEELAKYAQKRELVRIHGST